MSYINREALLAEYDREHKGPPGRARELIVNAPAADVREVKRGKWVEHHIPFDWMGFTHWTCSECGYGEKEKNINRTKFCPNCGADMREEQT